VKIINKSPFELPQYETPGAAAFDRGKGGFGHTGIN